MPEYKFETDEETLRKINAVEAKLGLTHEEFVRKAAEFIDKRERQFERDSSAEKTR